jgi:hypothetical protein
MKLNTFEEQWTYAMKYFIEYFYHFALVDGFNIHDSLDRASLCIFNQTFASSILHTGYNLWWPGGMDEPLDVSGWYPQDFNGNDKNSMQVFGDSSIYLFQPKVTLSANYGSPTFYFDGSAHGTSNVNLWRKTYAVSTSVPSGYTFNRFTYNGSTYYSNPSNIPIQHTGYLDAYFAPISYRYLDVYSGTGGYTSPSTGTYQYIQGQTAYVTAYATGGYTFDYWIVDGVNVGSSNPIGVSMNVDHYIQPVFYSNPPPQYSLSISSGGGGSTSPSPGTYWYNQGTGVQVSANAYGGYQFDHWVLDGYSYGQNPIYVTMNSNHNLQAVFWAIPSYTLTVSAYDDYTQQWLGPMVYIDGVPYSASWPVSVTAGYHTVAVETPYDYWVLSYFSDGLGNGDSRLINSNTNIVAHYWI